NRGKVCALTVENGIFQVPAPEVMELQTLTIPCFLRWGLRRARAVGCQRAASGASRRAQAICRAVAARSPRLGFSGVRLLGPDEAGVALLQRILQKLLVAGTPCLFGADFPQGHAGEILALEIYDRGTDGP